MGNFFHSVKLISHTKCGWMVSGWCLDGVLFWFVPNLKVLEAGGCLEGVWTVSRLPNFNFLFSVKVVVVLVLVLVTS